MRFLSRFRLDRTGAATIEFALTVIIFIFLVFFVAEMARMAYISSALDLAISESAKDAKNAKGSQSTDYQARFNERLLNQGGSLWGFVSQSDVTEVSITYSDSLQAMIDNGGQSGSAENQSLARYQVQYRYHPMFFPFPKDWANSLFKREVIFVQEYERSKFMD